MNNLPDDYFLDADDELVAFLGWRGLVIFVINATYRF